MTIISPGIIMVARRMPKRASRPLKLRRAKANAEKIVVSNVPSVEMMPTTSVLPTYVPKSKELKTVM